MADFRSIDQFLDRKFDRDVLSTRLRVSRGGGGEGGLWSPGDLNFFPGTRSLNLFLPGSRVKMMILAKWIPRLKRWCPRAQILLSWSPAPL